jgi:hypothetical protein
MVNTVTYTTKDYLPNPRPEIQYIRVRDCQLASYKKDPENKALVGMLLKILHHSSSDSNDKTILYNGQASFQQRGGARQHRMGERHYD